jgi:hypothetical protein
LQIGSRTITGSYTLGTLAPRASGRAAVTSYTVPRHSGNTTQGTYRITNTSPAFSCSASLRLP